MEDQDDTPKKPLRAMAAAAGASVSSWSRHGRADIQASHSLTVPLARWAPGLIERPATEERPRAPDFAIPDAVLHARPPQRLPGDSVCRSPIAGLVVAIVAPAGHRVSRGDPVLVVEAMKMQNSVPASLDGIVTAMYVMPGDSVKAGQILFELA